MRKIRILHAADLHLDSAFDGLSDAQAAGRRAEQRALLDRIVSLAKERSADMILLAGDLLDSSHAYLETAQAIVKAFSAADMPVIISPGNHDWYSPASPYARLELPPNVHIFSKPEMECLILREFSCRVWGAAFRESGSRGLLCGFHAEKEAGTLDVMCIHGDVGARDSAYNPISEEELASSGMDYAALGHVHLFSGLRRAGRTYYAWPGCAEGRGFDECGEKGVIIAEVSEDSVSADFVPLGTRKYMTLSVDVSAGDALEAVKAALPDDTSRDIYRITLRGERNDAPDLAALKLALGGRFYSLQLCDGTSVRRDVWEGAGDETLRGVFLGKLRAAFDKAAGEEEKERIVKAARWGLAALDGAEEVSAL